MAQITRPEISHPRPRVGYLGPEGTFSEEAVLSASTPEAVEPVPLQTIYDTVMALRRRQVDWAVVPIENSLDGSISVTLDLLAGEASDVEIVGETLLRVRHSLIAAEPLALNEIEEVLTHPQVPGQCTRFLRRELPHARILPASSTAEAVRIVAGEHAEAGRRRGRAALGTVLAARIYGGTVLRDGGAGDWKTSLVFWGPGAERPGWLVRCLDEFARRDINLTKIESRPRRERLGSYMFFADLTGRPGEAAVDAAVEGLRVLCEQVRVLGSYQGARQAAAG